MAVLDKGLSKRVWCFEGIYHANGCVLLKALFHGAGINVNHVVSPAEKLTAR